MDRSDGWPPNPRQRVDRIPPTGRLTVTTPAERQAAIYRHLPGALIGPFLSVAVRYPWSVARCSASIASGGGCDGSSEHSEFGRHSARATSGPGRCPRSVDGGRDARHSRRGRAGAEATTRVSSVRSRTDSVSSEGSTSTSRPGPLRLELSTSLGDRCGHQRRLGADEGRTLHLSSERGCSLKVITSCELRRSRWPRSSTASSGFPNGRRKDALREAAVEVFSRFTEDVLPFDAAAATVYPEIVDHRDRQGDADQRIRRADRGDLPGQWSASRHEK